MDAIVQGFGTRSGSLERSRPYSRQFTLAGPDVARAFRPARAAVELCPGMAMARSIASKGYWDDACDSLPRVDHRRRVRLRGVPERIAVKSNQQSASF